MLCDYLAQRIKRCLQFNDPQALIMAIGKVQSDTFKDGQLRSGLKWIDITDVERADVPDIDFGENGRLNECAVTKL
jgi:hypothetical protein